MARVTRQDVEYIANLAQLTLDEALIEQLQAEMTEILTYVDKLDELDTSGVEPAMHALEHTNVFREDTVLPSLDREQALDNAPSSDGEYFLVPRILDSE